MNTDILAGVLAFLPGLGIAVLNSRITRRVMEKDPNKLAMMSMPRQMLNILYLVALYALSGLFDWPLTPMLVGAAIGITIPSIIMAITMTSHSGSGTGSAENEEKEGY